MEHIPSRFAPATQLARLRNLRRASKPHRAKPHGFLTKTRKGAGTTRWTAVRIVQRPPLKVNGIRSPLSAGRTFHTSRSTPIEATKGVRLSLLGDRENAGGLAYSGIPCSSMITHGPRQSA